MAATSKGWSSPDGLNSLSQILKSIVPQWPNGPHDWQIETTARILDRRHQFVVVACGGGKTAVSYLPILALRALAHDTNLPRYGTQVPKNPVVLFIGPLSDLSVIQVAEMKKMGVSAVTLESATVREAREKEGCDLWKEVIKCQYSVVLLSPERLTHPNLGTILRDEGFRRNIVALLLDEAHLIIPWGLDFRKAYGQIPRLRARIPPWVPCAAVTATSCIGKKENQLFQLLRFQSNNFKLTRLSNERANVCKAYVTLTHALNGPDFPDIAWICIYQKKTIVYCRQIKTCLLVANFLRSLLPPGPHRLHRIRQYHSLLDRDRNLETLHAFETDPNVFCVVATIKFGMGLDARGVAFVVILGLPTTIETGKQEEGRVARDERLNGLAVTYIEKSVINAIEKELKESSSLGAGKTADMTIEEPNQDGEEEEEYEVEDVEEIHGGLEESLGATGGKKRTRKIDPELKVMVRCHIVGACLVAEDNRIFGNRGPLTSKNCLQARRPLPCSSCRLKLIPYQTLQAMIPTPQAPTRSQPTNGSQHSLIPSSSSSRRGNNDSGTGRKAKKSHKALTKAMKDAAEVELLKFARERWLLKRQDGLKFQMLPSVCFFSHNSLANLLSELHRIRDRNVLTEVLLEWEYLDIDGDALYNFIELLNVRFDRELQEAQDKSNAKRKETKAKKEQLKTEKDTIASTKSTQARVAKGQVASESHVEPEEKEGDHSYHGVENTPPSTPSRRSEKRKMASSKGTPTKPRKKSRVEENT